MALDWSTGASGISWIARSLSPLIDCGGRIVYTDSDSMRGCPALSCRIVSCRIVSCPRMMERRRRGKTMAGDYFCYLDPEGDGARAVAHARTLGRAADALGALVAKVDKPQNRLLLGILEARHLGVRTKALLQFCGRHLSGCWNRGHLGARLFAQCHGCRPILLLVHLRADAVLLVLILVKVGTLVGHAHAGKHQLVQALWRCSLVVRLPITLDRATVRALGSSWELVRLLEGIRVTWPQAVNDESLPPLRRHRGALGEPLAVHTVAWPVVRRQYEEIKVGGSCLGLVGTREFATLETTTQVIAGQVIGSINLRGKGGRGERGDGKKTDDYETLPHDWG